MEGGRIWGGIVEAEEQKVVHCIGMEQMSSSSVPARTLSAFDDSSSILTRNFRRSKSDISM